MIKLKDIIGSDTPKNKFQSLIAEVFNILKERYKPISEHYAQGEQTITFRLTPKYLMTVTIYEDEEQETLD